MADDKNNDTQQQPPNKKARPLPPLDDYSKYVDVIFILRRLQGAWNLLDTDGESSLEYLSESSSRKERNAYLSDMREVLKDDVCSYENPLGTDDREGFINNFQELMKREQEDFRALALKCKEANCRLTDNDLNELLSKAPTEPFCISLKPMSEGQIKNADGSERRPFPSIEAAVKYRKSQGDDEIEVLQIQVVDCPLTCSSTDKKKCLKSGCEVRLCVNHGDGWGTWVSEEDQVTWHFCKCTDCDVVSCLDHELPECDVCSNLSRAEGNMYGGDGSGGAYPLCNKCATVCEGTEDENGEELEGETCGFRCCRTCITNHNCGYDPSQFY